MTESGSHRRPEPELRPQPQRPDFVVEPLRPRPESAKPSGAFRLALAAWVAVAAAVVGMAAVVAVQYDAVRDALEATVRRTSSGATSTEIADTVRVTVLGSAAVAAVLLLVAAVGLSLARAKPALSGVVTTVAGLAVIGASILFHSFTSDTGAIAAGALQWGPWVAASLAAVATVASAAGLTRR